MGWLPTSVPRAHTHTPPTTSCAGTYGRSGVTVDNVTEEDMQDVFQVNTIGPLLVVQQLRRQGLLGGHTPSLIGNMTSKVGGVVRLGGE